MLLFHEIIFLSIVFIFLLLSEGKLSRLSSNGTYFVLFCLLAVYLVILDVRREINFKNVESFTPRVLRPYLRDARIYTQGLISNKRDDFNRLYRQFGL